MDPRKRRTMQLVSGAAIAISAAQLFVADGGIAAAADQEKAKIHCSGVNACKGKSECSSAKNGCKGQNECKGQGWVSMTENACVTKGGTAGKS